MSAEAERDEGAARTAISRRSVALGIGFALTAATAAAVTPRRHERTIGDAKLDAIVPQKAGPWSAAPGGPLVLPEAGQPSSFYDQVLTRSYFAPGLPPLMMLIAYGAAQSGLMKVHRPEVCYASAGFSIHDDRPASVPLGPSRTVACKAFLAKREDHDEQVLYWTRISDTFPRDLTAQRMVVFERGLQGLIPDGVLVRFSTIGDDQRTGQAAMQRFAASLVASAGPAGRALLIGDVRPKALG